VVYRKINGKPERITLGRYPDLSIEQARHKAMEINVAIAQGRNPNDKRRLEQAEITLGNLFHEYMERYAKLHKKTWKIDEARFKSHLAPWDNKRLSQVTKADIQKLHADMGRNHKVEANRLLALVSIMFNKAIEFGLWDKLNPVSGIKKFREKSRDRFLQSEELPRFFTALAEEPNETIRDYILMAILTGARRSNLLAMKWEEISWERFEWRIPTTKNEDPQTVTLSEEAVAILKRRKTAASNQYVFPGSGQTGHLVEPKKGWLRILNDAGIENLRIHDLRRTLGSWQAKTGASLTIIGKSLNHKSLQATAIYARLDLDPVRESVEKATDAILTAAGLKEAKKPGLNPLIETE
jgi:integrase